MAICELEKTEVATDGVESFAGFEARAAAQGAGRNRPWFGPAFEYRFSVIVAQRSKVNKYGAKGKLQIKATAWKSLSTHVAKCLGIINGKRGPFCTPFAI